MKILKLILAVLLLLCLLDMPYGYYELVRMVSFTAFAYLAFATFKKNAAHPLIWVYAGLSLLFQPFFKIALGRDLWNIVDVVVAAFLLFSLTQKDFLGTTEE